MKAGAAVLLGLGAAGAMGLLAWAALGLPAAAAAGGAALPPAGGAGEGAASPSTSADLAVERAVTKTLDDVVPGLQAAAAELRQALLTQPGKVRLVLDRYRQTASKFADKLAEQRLITAQYLADAQGVLSGIKTADAVFDVVGVIPIVGQIVKGAYQIARTFAVAEADARKQGRHVTEPLITLGVETFFGWLADPSKPGEGDYWALNLPVLSFAAPIQIHEYRLSTGKTYAVELNLLAVLCQARPFGLSVPRVDCTPSGQYSYKFNVSGNNDVSDAATDRKEVYWVYVWRVDDISPTGPKGFDPKNPQAWYRRAQAEALAVPAAVKHGQR